MDSSRGSEQRIVPAFGCQLPRKRVSTINGVKWMETRVSASTACAAWCAAHTAHTISNLADNLGPTKPREQNLDQLIPLPYNLQAASRHKTAPTATAALGRALLGTLLMGSFRKEDEAIQVGHVSLVGPSAPLAAHLSRECGRQAYGWIWSYAYRSTKEL